MILGSDVARSLAGPFLGEWIGWRRAIGIVVGFSGILIAFRPGFTEFHPAFLVSMGSMLAYAFFSLVTRYLAPYGHDGRMSSLRDFVHNVIVNEFSGPEPSPVILDAIVGYLQDIDFLPNPTLGPGGRLTGQVSDAERRGEALFLKPFPHDSSQSCASCHVPSAAFVDHQQHDIGSGGMFKTPTLRNADFNAPYFHYGRFDTFDQVVAHFDRVFDLGLSAQDRHDLVAYLTAVGDGTLPYGWLTDNTRWQRKPDTFSSVEQALQDTAQFYRKALWADADAYVEIWLEKDALAGVNLAGHLEFRCAAHGGARLRQLVLLVLRGRVHH